MAHLLGVGGSQSCDGPPTENIPKQQPKQEEQPYQQNITINKLGLDFHDKKEEMTKMRRHDEVETTMKETRRMEELSSPYQQTTQSI